MSQFNHEVNLAFSLQLLISSSIPIPFIQIVFLEDNSVLTISYMMFSTPSSPKSLCGTWKKFHPNDSLIEYQDFWQRNFVLLPEVFAVCGKIWYLQENIWMSQIFPSTKHSRTLWELWVLGFLWSGSCFLVGLHFPRNLRIFPGRWSCEVFVEVSRSRRYWCCIPMRNCHTFPKPVVSGFSQKRSFTQQRGFLPKINVFYRKIDVTFKAGWFWAQNESQKSNSQRI